MARRRIIEPNKKCNSCRTVETRIWHKDQWGRIGWMCHCCHNCISQKEERGIVCKL